MSCPQEEQQAEASADRGASSEGIHYCVHDEEARHTVLGYVVEQLNEQLFRELMEGFHAEGSENTEIENDASYADDHSEEEEEEWHGDDGYDP